MAWGFQAQAAIALEERLTSPNLREDAPSLLVRVRACRACPRMGRTRDPSGRASQAGREWGELHLILGLNRAC